MKFFNVNPKLLVMKGKVNLNPFPQNPFSSKSVVRLLDSIKMRNLRILEEILKADKFLVYSFDYVK